VSYLQAFVIAIVQGVTELFPVSSLGHSVLIPAWIGGSWQTMVTQSPQASSETSFYLAYIVTLQCATALALLWFFRADWARIIRGLLTSPTWNLGSQGSRPWRPPFGAGGAVSGPRRASAGRRLGGRFLRRWRPSWPEA
jgi:undecaprenyl pyrophosphate phosphatase UppP